MMSEGQKNRQVKVFRFDPEKDQEPRYETYSIPLEKHTVLDVLRYIYEDCDPTLAFRFGCAGAVYLRCGACALLVNGRPTFSCKKLAEEEMTIEPHPKFEVIRDLAVDFEKARRGPTKIAPAVKITIDPDRCNACGDCVRICALRVYEVRKDGRRGISVPVDIEGCCGLTCMQCAIYCKNSAIKIETIA